MTRGSAEPIRVRYSEQETGWAVPLRDGIAVIRQIPLTDRCNVRDVVLLEAAGPDGLPRVGKVIHRRFPAKSLLYYRGDGDLQILCTLLHALGCETECVRQPNELAPGVLLVAHDRHVRADLLANAIGIPQPTGDSHPPDTEHPAFPSRGAR